MVVRRPPPDPRRPDRARGRAARATRASSRSAAAPATISRCCAASAGSTRSSSTARRGRWPAAGSAMRSATRRCRRCAGVPDGTYDLIALLDVLEHVDGDQAALREHRRQARAGRPDPGHRAGLSMDVERARRRPPPQAALFEAGLRRVAEAAGLKVRPDRLFQQPALPARRGGRGSPARSLGKTASDDKMPPRAAQPAVRRRSSASSVTSSAGCRSRPACRCSRCSRPGRGTLVPLRQTGRRPWRQLRRRYGGGDDQPDIVERVAREDRRARRSSGAPDLARGSGWRVTIWVGSRMNGQPGL